MRGERVAGGAYVVEGLVRVRHGLEAVGVGEVAGLALGARAHLEALHRVERAVGRRHPLADRERDEGDDLFGEVRLPLVLPLALELQLERGPMEEEGVRKRAGDEGSEPRTHLNVLIGMVHELFQVTRGAALTGGVRAYVECETRRQGRCKLRTISCPSMLTIMRVRWGIWKP